ncbi:MAG: hypothetical protein AABX60_04215 [Nanoarchaeota archaeon]
MSSKSSMSSKGHAEREKAPPQPTQPPMQPLLHEQASHHHHERNIIMAFVAVGVIVVIGFFMAKYVISLVTSDDKGAGTRDYNGFEFVKRGNTWFTEWERGGIIYSLEFRHSPWEVENIPVRGSVDARFQLSYIFITHDPTNESSRATAFVALAAADLATMLKGVFERAGVAAACTANITDACADRPIVTCSTNASVIYLKVSNETGISLNGNCVTIQGYEEGLTMAVDKGLYQWLGIVKK